MSSSLLQITEVSLALIAELRPLVAVIARHDRSLADQLRRAASSVPLNASEASRRCGGDRLHHFRIASGSAAEARTALAVARAWGYVSDVDAAPADALLDRALAMLWRITHPRQ